MAAARDLSSPLDGFNDTAAFAKRAGLRYVNDDQPGIRRKRRGKGFGYEDAKGDAVRDQETLERIRSLAIPPAWTDVWICPHENGHLQATGRDARGRKQYRYHPKWRQVRDETKYERLVPFGQALPSLRGRVKRDLALAGLPRPKVVATVVHLLDETLMRVGNEEYARTNDSYGLTTLQDRHADIVQGKRLLLSFRGKSGKRHEVDLEDTHVARIVAKTQALPGQDLFQYIDDEGEPRRVGSEDVNEYLQDAMGEPYTAKEFRTWAGTVCTAVELRATDAPASKTAAKRETSQAIKRVAKQLGNTPAVCRKCYVHPAVLDAYLEGELHDALEEAQKSRSQSKYYDPEEATVLAFLEQHQNGE